MNELCTGLEYVRAHINDLLIISYGNFEDDANKKNSFKGTKSNWFHQSNLH